MKWQSRQPCAIASALRRADTKRPAAMSACARTRELTAFARPAHRVVRVATFFEKLFHQSVQLFDFARGATRRLRVARGNVPLKVQASVFDALHPVVEVEDVLRGDAERQRRQQRDATSSARAGARTPISFGWLVGFVAGLAGLDHRAHAVRRGIEVSRLDRLAPRARDAPGLRAHRPAPSGASGLAAKYFSAQASPSRSTSTLASDAFASWPPTLESSSLIASSIDCMRSSSKSLKSMSAAITLAASVMQDAGRQPFLAHRCLVRPGWV